MGTIDLWKICMGIEGVMDDVIVFFILVLIISIFHVDNEFVCDIVHILINITFETMSILNFIIFKFWLTSPILSIKKLRSTTIICIMIAYCKLTI